MKRLVLIALLLAPASYHALKQMEWFERAPHSGRSIATTPIPPVPPVPPQAPVPPAPPTLALQPQPPYVTPHVKGRGPSAVKSRTAKFMRVRRGGISSSSGTAVAATPDGRSGNLRLVESDWMATTERAVTDAHRKLEREVSDWLARAGVPRTWQPSKRLIDQMIRKTDMQHSDFKYAVMHKQQYQVEFSKPVLDRMLAAREREIGGKRLLTLGGGLALMVAALAAVSGYIRADEATKGYYTNHLRVAAGLGLATAGYVAYRLLS